MNHLIEWTNSGVDEQIVKLNVKPLEGAIALDYLFYSDTLPRRNDGGVGNNFLKRYGHIQQGGWWCSGIDILTGDDDVWGCFKPCQPRQDEEGKKIIKYEHPPKTATGIFALRVPLHIWQRIAQRYDLEIAIDDHQPDLGFWQWLIDHPQIPLCITEGAKKAGALLTAGYAAIALPGINNGYRTPKDEWGNTISKSHLIPQLQKLATPGREIYLAFDQDTKASAKKAVEAALKKIGYLLNQAGCLVKIISWNPALGKGVDDLIIKDGQQPFHEAYQNALLLDTWKAKSFLHLTYTSNIKVNSRYLETLNIPEKTKLIALKSPKGTGKTEFLANIVSQALNKGQKVLVIGHRIRLVEALCQRFGLPYITTHLTENSVVFSGYGLCIDSLHGQSSAHFNPHNWQNSIVIIDEVEQVLWHCLNSSTCKNHRVAILQSLKNLIQNVVGSNGQVYIADADLSNISLDYLIALAGIPITPFIIENEWKPTTKEAWQVNTYHETNPKKLVTDLERHIKQGGKPMICLSGQKLSSKWGTRTLEVYLQKQFPQARILRIDSESLADPTHAAYGCINNLNQVLGNYDIVLASPSIETGVSIELKGHFTSVWAIAQGVQTVNSVCQSLARIRENIPRYIWCAHHGFNQVGNGATSIPSLLSSGNRLTQFNIRSLQQSDFAAIDDLDTGFQAESLLCWAKMAVRLNAAMSNYRDAVLAALLEEGHNLVDSPTGKIDAETIALTTAIANIREENYQAECVAITKADDLDERQYQLLKKQPLKQASQIHSLRKHELVKKYKNTVDVELINKDDDGWYEKLRLHYFLTCGRQYLAQRDSIVARKLMKQGQGNLFLPDFNDSQLGAIIGIMELLGIAEILEDSDRRWHSHKGDRELRNSDEDLLAMAKIALTYRSDLKTVVGIGIGEKDSPVTILRRFLQKIDYKLKCVRCVGTDSKRIRVYQIVQPQDQREKVFAQWLAVDKNNPGTSEL